MPVIANPGRIHSLPSVLASQIAAGEVIERPASVVKELIENSLDAGAGRIQIDIEAAGSRLIRVRDDGDGVHPEDLPLAIAPHSTSKIHNVDDLAAITSLGFRGEALASIAAVARLRISSRHGDQPAREIQAEPGQAATLPSPTSHPAGTSIEVRDLFFNMPARRKFLRTEQTEFLHILELVKSLSLSQSGLGVRLTHNGRSVFQISAASSMADRIGRIFGNTFSDAACLVDETDGAMRLQGVAGQATAARSQADRQYLFLNGRLIRDRRLNHALRTAYQEALPAGRYAPFLLYLEMDPAAYDINVHPTKHEVRFRASRDVHDFVFSALRRSLAADRPLSVWQPRAEQVSAQPGMGIAEPRNGDYQNTLHSTAATAGTEQQDRPPFGRLLGCVMDRYVVTATAESFTVIDACAALEHLTRLDLDEPQPLQGRPLLLPETLSVSADQLAGVERWQSSLAALALELEQSSPTQVMLRALPAALPAVDARSLLPALIDSLAVAKSGSDLHERVCGLLAAHAGHGFDVSEAAPLLQRLHAALEQNRLAPPRPWKTLDAAGLAAWLEHHD